MVSIWSLGRGVARAARGLQIRQAEKRDAAEHLADYEADITSGRYDTGGLGNFETLQAEGMTEDGERSIYLGIDPETNENVYHIDDTSIQAFGLPGVGKGSTLIQTNLGHVDNRYSIVCFGLSCENVRVAADYRRNVLGQNVYVDNADGLYGIESVAVDPIAHIRAAAARTDLPDKKRLELVENLAIEYREVGILRKPEDNSPSGWIGDDARRYMSALLTTTAMEWPTMCSLPALYEFANIPPGEQFGIILQRSQIPSVRNEIDNLKAQLDNDAGKQVQWVINRLRESLELYRNGTARGNALSGDVFDVAELRRRPTTLFIELAEKSLERDAAHVSRIMTALTHQLGDIDGPQKRILFIIDEASQLPRMPIGNWIRSYRKRGLQYFCFWQSAESCELIYGKAGAEDLMISSRTKLWLSVGSEARARTLSLRAGDYTSWDRSTNVSRGGHSGSAGMSERPRPRLPISDILNMPHHAMLIDRAGMPLTKAVRLPWWNVSPYDERLKHFSQMTDTR